MSFGSLLGKPLEVLFLSLLGLHKLHRVLLCLLPGLAALYDGLELEHHGHELRVLHRCQDPVQAHQVLRVLSVHTLTYPEHVFGFDLLDNEEIVELLIELFHVPLEDGVALEALLLDVIFEFEAVLVTQGLQELLEVSLLAEGLQARDEIQV